MVSEDALEKAIRFSKISYVDLMRVQYDDRNFIFYLYDSDKKETWGTMMDKESARQMIEILAAFIDDIPTINLERGDRMYG